MGTDGGALPLLYNTITGLIIASRGIRYVTSVTAIDGMVVAMIGQVGQ